MGEVVKFRLPRNETIRGVARGELTGALNSVKKPSAVVIVVLSVDGSYSMRCASDFGLPNIDIYGRVGGVIEHERQSLLHDD